MFKKLVYIVIFAICFDFTIAAKTNYTLPQLMNLVFPSSKSEEGIKNKNGESIVKSLQPSKKTETTAIPKDALGFLELTEGSSPVMEGQKGSLGDIANKAKQASTGLKGCDDLNVQENEGCQPSEAEIQRRQELANLQQQKPEQSGQPPQMPKMPEGGGGGKEEGGGKGGEQGGGGGGKGKEGPMEGFSDQEEKKMKFKCDKSANNCKPEQKKFAKLKDEKSGSGKMAWMEEKPGASSADPGQKAVQKGKIIVGDGSVFTDKVSKDLKNPGTFKAAGLKIPRELVQTGDIVGA